MSDPEQTDGPPTRAERQRRTRRALIDAARLAFARDGYHGANLEAIAREAGFSKGAVYSNFDGKAALFLAVMDVDLDTLRADGWQPWERLEDCGQPAGEQDTTVRGFALATLEFVATAARDDTLADQLAARVQVLLDAYGRVVAGSERTDEPLAPEELAALLAALDQGFALLEVAGVAWLDRSLLVHGLRRLLDPSEAGAAAITAPADR